MSLLDNASLVLTPNAYKEGKLYSVIPSNGNGDFTVTRATTATRVNSSGLVDLVPYNLVRYSEMFADASWSKVSTTITANTTTAPDGTLTADTLTADGTSASHGVSQPGISITSGTSYTLSIYAKKNTNNFIQILANNGAYISNPFANFDLNIGVVGSVGSGATASITSVGNGWYRCLVTMTANTSGLATAFRIDVVTSVTSPRLETNTLSTSVFIWGAQLVEGTSARDYLRTETRLNIPRIDYSLGGCPNILLEPQRTNLALQSSSFDNATWGKSASSVTTNSTTSPSGLTDADTWTADGSSSFKLISQGSLSVTTGVAYTFSIYAKKGTNNFIQIFGITAQFSANPFANFDLNNGVVGSTGGGATATITNVGNGWYRCTMTATATATGATSFYNAIVTSAASPRLESNSLSTSVFLWGAQLEAGAYATSYIPTTTASVTRNADSITRNNIFTNGLITAAGGTWFVELRNNRVLTRDAYSTSLGVGNAATGVSNGFYIAQIGGAVNPSFRKITGVGTEVILFTITTGTAKLAVKWNGSTMDVFQNGVKVVSATAFAVTNMEFLFGYGNDVPKFINQMALYPTPLSDGELITMTTL